VKEDLIKIFVDKGLLSLIILVSGYWLNKYLEISKQTNALKNKIKETNRDKALSTIEKQLSNFYYPIYFRLQKDNVLWKLSPQLWGKEESLPSDTNNIIEIDSVLKNHLEIVNVIENNIHFIEVDEDLQAAINSYIKHVTVYDIIRKTESIKHLNPIDFKAPYPKKFEQTIKDRMNSLTQRNNELLKEI
jgi:hypothetical protein